MRKWILLAILIISVAGLSIAQVEDQFQEGTDNRGTAGLVFLKLPATPRALALGGAAFSGDKDASATFYNISEIGDTTGVSMFYARQSLYEDMFFLDNIAVSTKVSERMGITFFAQYLSTDPIDITTLEEPEGTGATYDFSSIAMGAGFGMRVTKRFSIGAKFKYVQESIKDTNASAIAVDIATLYRLNFLNAEIATVFNNYGPDSKFGGNDLWNTLDPTPDEGTNIPPEDVTDINQPYSLNTKEFALPINIAVSVKMDLIGENSFIEIDDNVFSFYTAMVKSNDSDETFSFGGEYTYSGLSSFDFVLRGGYKVYQEEDWDNKASFGAGIKYNYGESNSIFIDYAYANHVDLDATHFFSVGFNF